MGRGATSSAGESGEDGLGELGKQVAGGDFQETVKPTLNHFLSAMFLLGEGILCV